MKRRSKRILSLMLVLSTFMVGCSSSKGSDNVEWKLGHAANEEHMWHKTAEKFAELVDEKTEGQIKVKIYPSDQLGGETDTINAVRSGAADMVISGETLQNWAPKAALMAVPYAFNSVDELRTAIDGEAGEEILSEINEKAGLVPLYYHVRAPRNLTTNKPINNVSDLKGLKMRVPNSPLYVSAWEAAGASPQVMSLNEVFTGLQQNVIAAQENPNDLIYSSGFYEVQKYVNKTEHVYGWTQLFIGDKQWDSITPELQEKVLEASKEAQEFADNLFDEEVNKYEAILKEKGMIINEDVDKDSISAAMEKGIKKTLPKDVYELYTKMKSN